MPDEIDLSVERQQADLDRMIQAARCEVLPGEAGECDLCGEWSGRLINGVCAPCRDKYKVSLRGIS